MGACSNALLTLITSQGFTAPQHHRQLKFLITDERMVLHPGDLEGALSLLLGGSYLAPIVEAVLKNQRG